MKSIFYLVLPLITLFSCTKGDSQKSLELKEKELNLRERELNLKEAEVLKKKDSQVALPGNLDVQTSKPIIKSLGPDDIFKQWESNLKEKGIFDYVSKTDCNNKAKMMKLYDQGKYPMHTSTKSVLDFEYNNDGIKDYVINYTLENCVQGNGWDTDFIFVTSKDGNLQINHELTNKLKKQYFNFVKGRFGEDQYVRMEKGYLIVKSFKIDRVSDGVCYGDFNLMQDGPSCCPEISGEFSYDIRNNEFSTYNIKKESM